MTRHVAWSVGQANCANLKTEFNNYKKILRRSINEAKRQYYSRTFELYKNNIKQTWSVIKNTLQKKYSMSRLDEICSEQPYHDEFR